MSHFSLTCNQKLSEHRDRDVVLCGEPALFIGYWTGNIPLSLCERHALWLQKVGQTIGFEPRIYPFTEEMRSEAEREMASDASERLGAPRGG